MTSQKENYRILSLEQKAIYESQYKETAQIVKQYKIELENLLKESIACNDISLYISKIAGYEKELEKASGEITNMFEDLFGAVRVYVKVRKLIPSLDDTALASQIHIKVDNNIKITMECNGKPPIQAKFFGAFDETFKNIDVFTGYTGNIGPFKKLDSDLKTGEQYDENTTRRN